MDWQRTPYKLLNSRKSREIFALPVEHKRLSVINFIHRCVFHYYSSTPLFPSLKTIPCLFFYPTTNPVCFSVLLACIVRSSRCSIQKAQLLCDHIRVVYASLLVQHYLVFVWVSEYLKVSTDIPENSS